MSPASRAAPGGSTAGCGSVPRVRWRDGAGVRWRLSQQRLAWRRRVKPEVALEWAPGGLGDDPISLVVGLPFLLLFAIMMPLWAVELVARLVATPVVVVLRLGGVEPYRLTLYRKGIRHARYTATGRAELVRLRAALRERPGQR